MCAKIDNAAFMWLTDAPTDTYIDKHSFGSWFYECESHTYTHTNRLLVKTERIFTEYVAECVFSICVYACFDLITSTIELVCKKRKFQSTNRIDESDMY